MRSTRSRKSTRPVKTRSIKSIRDTIRTPSRTEHFDQRKAAAILRALRRRIRNFRLGELYKSQTQAAPEMRNGAHATALTYIRSRLENARSAARVCVGILDAQAADLDGEVALTLQRCVCSELSGQIRHINRLLDAGAP